MEGTINDLKCREVVNICDGTRMGYVEDVQIDLCLGRITAIVVPGQRRLMNVLGRRENIVIPWSAIRNIGDDIVLVDMPQRPCGGTREWESR